MLDGQSGEIRFDEPAVAISPQLTRAEFLASPLCRGAKISLRTSLIALGSCVKRTALALRSWSASAFAVRRSAW